MSNKSMTRRGEFFPSVFNDFLKPWESLFDTNGGSLLANLSPVNIPAVNVIENNNNYEISVAAPGMKKDDFRIDVEGNILTISAETEQKKEEKEGKYTRKEYNYSSFSRNFTLPEGVNKDKIDATYENGLLRLELPKTEEAKKVAPRHIAIK